MFKNVKQQEGDNIKTADFHIHSQYSDGTLTSEEIIKIASEHQVQIISITDHNELSGSKELMKLQEKYNVSCIAGVELDCIHNASNIHILGYGFDLEDKDFNNFVTNNAQLLEDVNRNLIQQLELKYKQINFTTYEQYNFDRSKGGWKALHYFIDCGISTSIEESFAFYFKYGSAYNKIAFPSSIEVIDQIHKAGGYAVLAHPGIIYKYLELDEFKRNILEFLHIGIDGIECYYPCHTKEQTEYCVHLCEENGKIITSGSDCHGSFEDTKIGEMKIPLEKLKLSHLVNK